MKRILSVFLLLALLFTLAACAVNPGSSGKEEKTVQERLDAGEEVLAAFCCESVTSEFMVMICNYMEDNFGAMGVTFQSFASEGNNATMISQIENLITMEADVIIVAPPDPNAVEDVCMKAMDAGVGIVFMGFYPEYGDRISGGAYVDWPQIGVELGKMATDWLDKTYPDAGAGEIHAASFRYNSNAIYVALMDALDAYLAENEPRVQVTYVHEEQHSLESGYNGAQEALTSDPEIRLFLCNLETPGVGVNNFILSKPGYDLSEFAVFGTGVQDTGVALIEQAKAGESVYRGTIAYGTYGASAAGIAIPAAGGLFQVAKSVLLGEHDGPFWVKDDLWSIDSFDYGAVLDDPNNDFFLEAFK